MVLFRIIFCHVLVFMAGGLCYSNLIRLIGFTPNYAASWGNVVMAAGVAILFSHYAYSDTRKYG